MTDAELELDILRRYVEHYDAVGQDAIKCARELDMRQVIAEITRQPVPDGVAVRWHARLAPQSPPYPPGVLRSCSDSTVNNGPHRFHARAYFEPGKAPAWDRIQQLEQQLSATQPLQKEKEQKFGIVSSLRQAETDFASYLEGVMNAIIGVLFLDIDDFKALNRTFTESVVDRDILIPFQQLLRIACNYRGDVYRHGGEEFLLLLPNHTKKEVIQFAERLRGNIEVHRFAVDGASVKITASIGIAFSGRHGEVLQDLIAKANRAENLAKSKGKNRVEVYGE